MTDLQHEKVITPDSLPARFFFYNSSSQFVPSHWHNSVELLYMKSGLMDVGINSRTYSLKKGDLIIINSGDIHSTRCLNSSFVLALQIPYPLLKRTFRNITVSVFRWMTDPRFLTRPPVIRV